MRSVSSSPLYSVCVSVCVCVCGVLCEICVVCVRAVPLWSIENKLLSRRRDTSLNRQHTRLNTSLHLHLRLRPLSQRREDSRREHVRYAPHIDTLHVADSPAVRDAGAARVRLGGFGLRLPTVGSEAARGGGGGSRAAWARITR